MFKRYFSFVLIVILSTLANAQDEKYNLLLEYGRLIQEVHTCIVSMENVPHIEDTNIFAEFLQIKTVAFLPRSKCSDRYRSHGR